MILKYSVLQKEHTSLKVSLPGRYGMRIIPIYKNPTHEDYAAIKERFNEEYPNAPRGEPTTRFTYDLEGNRYCWMAGDGIHYHIENALFSQHGIKTDQNANNSPEFVEGKFTQTASSSEDKSERFAKLSHLSAETNPLEKYKLCSGWQEHTITSRTNPKAEKNGIVLDENVAERLNDPALAGYKGLHVGEAKAWLPILNRDGYVSGNAYVYAIDVKSLSRDGISVYQVEDYDVVDWSSTPDSLVIFMPLDKIPAKYITFVRKIPEKDIPYAPELDGGYFEDEKEQKTFERKNERKWDRFLRHF